VWNIDITTDGLHWRGSRAKMRNSATYDRTKEVPNSRAVIKDINPPLQDAVDFYYVCSARNAIGSRHDKCIKPREKLGGQ
jgi:hypothetical protein